MKLRIKYILFIVLIHLTALVLSFYIFKENKLLFICSEIIFLISLYFSYRLYKAMVQPVELILTGVDAIEDQDFNIKFQPVGQYEMDRLIEVYNKMIDHLRIERTQKEQKHFFLEKLINTSPTGIIILDLDGKISSCNPKALSLIDLTENQIRDKQLKDLDTPLAKALSGLKNDETQILQIDGMTTYKCHKMHFIDRGFPNYFLIIEELTNEKLQIEKQAYGKVIRMMAHEVSNSIGPINSIMDSLLYFKNQLPDNQQNEYVEAIEIASNRNVQLNQFMHNFADVVRLPKPFKERTELQSLLKEMSEFMKYNRGEKQIEIEIDAPDAPLFIHVDRKQIEQVLINVLKNSIEAISEEGKITLVLTQKRSVPILQIIDTGIGFPKKENIQIFSPFYSTKTNGQGVGLTLSREILLNHGFQFSLISEENGPTIFTIEFE